MSQKMQGYIEEESALVRQLVRDRKAIAAPFVAEFGDKSPKRVCFIGSGSSYHVGYMAQPFVERAFSVETSVWIPSRMPAAGIGGHGENLYVLVSQSGRSTNTLKAVEGAGIQKEQIVSVTENPASPVALGAVAAVGRATRFARAILRSEGMRF